ncbi:hypothetical protein A5906_01130 [Bradyrhizobium sacchari]|nr:hypothetical protein A5906_01130 [Bradyrhizobium sacchari]
MPGLMMELPSRRQPAKDECISRSVIQCVSTRKHPTPADSLRTFGQMEIASSRRFCILLICTR